jgi:hypothetical protein
VQASQPSRHGRLSIEQAASSHRERRALSWRGGGTGGNEQLTAAAGVLLLLVFAVLGVTILQIRQLIWVHLFVGLLLIGPVALKMATTGYRFVRYYSGDPVYRHKGPPELGLRLIAPAVVLSTVVVFVSGIVLLFQGPSNRGQMLSIHKVSFFVWIAFTGLHVLGHIPRIGKSLRVARANALELGRSPGSAGRWLALVGAVVGGLVLAVVLIPHFAAWTASGAFPNHHHRG